MTKIAIDTNIWIYLSKDIFHELFQKLKALKNNDEIEILTNDIVIHEWLRNKETTIKSLSESIKQEYKSAKKIAQYLEDDKREAFLEFLKEIDSEEKRVQKAIEKVQEIEDIINSCTKIEVTEQQKLYISNLAIDKKGPFNNNKNNFNDALILRNFAEYCENNYPQKYDLIYVSNNPKDFCDPDTGEIFEVLKQNLEHIRIKSVTELGQAFDLSNELIDDFEDWLESALEQYQMEQFEISRGK